MSCANIGPVSYADSKWLPAWLPTQYVIRSYRWPVNTWDSIDAILSISDDNGYAKVTLLTSYETYLNREYIKISDSSVAAYNGVHQIIVKHSATEFTIDTSYTSTATGDFQRYYNNYHVKAEVYTGIPDGHSLAHKRPMALRGTVNVRPNKEGDAILDISSYVRNDLSPIQNKLCEILSGWIGNDWRMWTGFYIKYAESYDKSDGTEVTTFTSTMQTDLEGTYDINYYYASNSVHQFQHFQGKSMGEFAIQDTTPDEVPAKFMSQFEKPIYFNGWEYDVSILISPASKLESGYQLDYILKQYDSQGDLLSTSTDGIGYNGAGLYRFAFDCFSFNASTTEFTLAIEDTGNSNPNLTEVRRFELNRDCATSPIYLRWLNIHGNWEGWYFRQRKSFDIRTENRTTTRRNIYSNWDETFRTGDTQDDYISTEAYTGVSIVTGRLTKDQVDNLKWIRLSNKVVEVYEDKSSGCGNYRSRTVLIDPDTFVTREDRNKFYTLSFSFRYTDQILLQGQ